MMRVLLNQAVLLAFVIAFTAPFQATAGDSPSEDIKNVAREGVITHYKNGGDMQDSKKQAERDNAELGEGFRIFYIDTNKLTNDSTPQDLQTQVTPSDNWKFPVVSGGKTITYIRAYPAGTGEKWSASGSVPSPLPMEMDGIMTTWPLSSGYSHRYIRGIGAPVEFIEVSKEGKIVGYIPLSLLMAKTGRTKGEYKPSDLLDPQEMLKELLLQTKKHNDWFNPASDEIVNAAREAFRTQIKNRNTAAEVNSLRNYGFESQTDIANAELGEGFREFNLDTGKLLDETAPQDFQSFVRPGEWKFPIVVKGEIRSVITIRFSDGVWRFGRLDSGGGVAKELSGLETAWPASSGYQYRYISTGRFGSSSYIELSQRGKIVGVIPLKNIHKTPGRAEGVFKPSDLRDPQEILKELRTQIEKDRESKKYMGTINQTDKK